MPEKVSISAAAERLVLLEKREVELRAQMQATCSQYGMLTQELFIIMEAMKIELGGELERARTRSQLPNRFGGYLAD